jgi:hypothetical protein
MLKDRLLTPLAQQARNVAAMVIAAFWPGMSAAEVLARLMAMPGNRQAGVVSSVMIMMFLLALFAAQFGVIGLAVYFGAAVVIAA